MFRQLPELMPGAAQQRPPARAQLMVPAFPSPFWIPVSISIMRNLLLEQILLACWQALISLERIAGTTVTATVPSSRQQGPAVLTPGHSIRESRPARLW